MKTGESVSSQVTKRCPLKQNKVKVIEIEKQP
jgi:hypothetical protein